MDFKNCVRIMKKDWKLYLRNKEMLISMIILPLMFSTVFPFIMIYSALIEPDEFIDAYGEFKELMNIPEHYNKYLVAASIALRIFVLPYFLFTPSMISAIISADSFAGEKQRKTMESLALLPISKNELILGKVLVAFIPSILLSFIFFVFLGIEVNLIMLPYLDGNILIFTDITWLLTIFLLVPAITLFNIIIMVIISSRTKSFKGAQTISGLLITPIIIIMFMQTFNPAFLSAIMIIIISLIMIGICVLLVKIGKKCINIEKLIIMS